jgi:DNA-damage-inducible protein J
LFDGSLKLRQGHLGFGGMGGHAFRHSRHSRTCIDRPSRSDAKLTLLVTSAELDFSRCLGYNVAQEEVKAMASNSVVRARIDERTKREAAAALKKIGLTVSDAFRLLLVRIAAEKALPFEPLNPNAETVAAMKAARRGELVKVGKPDKLLRSLNAGS